MRLVEGTSNEWPQLVCWLKLNNSSHHESQVGVYSRVCASRAGGNGSDDGAKPLEMKNNGSVFYSSFLCSLSSSESTNFPSLVITTGGDSHPPHSHLLLFRRITNHQPACIYKTHTHTSIQASTGLICSIDPSIPFFWGFSWGDL